MTENLPVHMSDGKEIIDNELYISELSHNKEKIEYDSVSEMSLDSDFDEEVDKL